MPGMMPNKMGRLGRHGDTEIGHLTPGEVVVPRSVLQQPEMRRTLLAAFERAGLPLGRYQVGGADDSRNPRTGYREFYDAPGAPGADGPGGAGGPGGGGPDDNDDGFGGFGHVGGEADPGPPDMGSESFGGPAGPADPTGGMGGMGGPNMAAALAGPELDPTVTTQQVAQAAPSGHPGVTAGEFAAYGKKARSGIDSLVSNFMTKALVAPIPGAGLIQRAINRPEQDYGATLANLAQNTPPQSVIDEIAEAHGLTQEQAAAIAQEAMDAHTDARMAAHDEIEGATADGRMGGNEETVPPHLEDASERNGMAPTNTGAADAAPANNYGDPGDRYGHSYSAPEGFGFGNADEWNRAAWDAAKRAGLDTTILEQAGGFGDGGWIQFWSSLTPDQQSQWLANFRA